MCSTRRRATSRRDRSPSRGSSRRERRGAAGLAVGPGPFGLFLQPPGVPGADADRGGPKPAPEYVRSGRREVAAVWRIAASWLRRHRASGSVARLLELLGFLGVHPARNGCDSWSLPSIESVRSRLGRCSDPTRVHHVDRPPGGLTARPRTGHAGAGAPPSPSCGGPLPPPQTNGPSSLRSIDSCAN